jgi:ABC-type xylose transport system permease subunit
MSNSTANLSPPIESGSSTREFMRRILKNRSLRDSSLLLVLAGIWIYFYFSTNGTFLSPRNLILLALQSSIVMLAAISAVMLIVTRNFDLSVGSSVALIGVVVAVLTVKMQMDPILAVAISLGVGLMMGACGSQRWVCPLSSSPWPGCFISGAYR